MSEKQQVQPYPMVRVTFRPALDHGQLQKVAEVVMSAAAAEKASTSSIRRAS